MARRGRDGASAGGGALLFLDQTLAGDAVTGERQRFETLVADRLAAALALAERALVDLLQRGDDVAQQSPVAVAQLEEEFAVVGGIRLVAEILDRVVFLILAVGRVCDRPRRRAAAASRADFFLKLASRSFFITTSLAICRRRSR